MLTKRKIFLTVVLSLLTILAGATIVSAQDEVAVTDDQVNEVAQGLYCPICENTPLDVCPTQACADWRDEIRIMLSEGRSEAEIQAFFVDSYGPRVLAEPPSDGFNSLIWILPGAGLAIGAFVLGRSLLAMRQPLHASAASDAAPPSPTMLTEAEREYAAYVARLEREVEAFE